MVMSKCDELRFTLAVIDIGTRTSVRTKPNKLAYLSHF